MHVYFFMYTGQNVDGGHQKGITVTDGDNLLKTDEDVGCTSRHDAMQQSTNTPWP